MVHAASPDVEETMKWSAPHFDYQGQVMCGMAAFKEKVALGFWHGALITGIGTGPTDVFENRGPLRSVTDLPSKRVLTGLIKQAMKLSEDGVVVAKAKPSPKPEAEVPADLTRALAKHRRAKVAVEKFPPSHRREYCEWIGDAKREETRAKRVDQAVAWTAEGKSRNWTYQAQGR